MTNVIQFPNANAAGYFNNSARQGMAITSASWNDAADRRVETVRRSLPGGQRSALAIGDTVFSFKHERYGQLMEIELDIDTRKAVRFHVSFPTFDATLRPGEIIRAGQEVA